MALLTAFCVLEKTLHALFTSPRGSKLLIEMPPPKADKLEVESFENNRIHYVGCAKILGWTLAAEPSPSQTSCMNKVLLGPVFPVDVMDDRHRAALQVELAELEESLKHRRASMEEWRHLAARAERELDAPADLRERTIRRYKRKCELVASGERLRAILLAELYSQPQFQPAYHHSN